ncbi:MAG: TonB-dependent siderophore receptor [Gammaproteobacteria bacterium]|nr:TonB-dependent siderophore receptor [Gammaproteobacteria bacterium]
MTTFTKSPINIAVGIALVTCAISAQAAGSIKELAVTKVQDQQTGQYHTGKYHVEKVATHKITTALVDTPKTVTVISGALLEDQGVTTMAEALRNVSGVSTFGAGEGGGGNITTNDKLTIRGFSANESIYIDGIRDLSSYSRDLFNYEQIEITKGANSSIAGKGTSGGAVNLVTKRADMEMGFSKAKVSFDQAQTKRVSIDSNLVFNQDTALRVNAVVSDGGDIHDNGVENYKTQGLAFSLLHNISDKTAISGDVLILKQNNNPMLGLPWVTKDVAADTSYTEGAIDKSLWDIYYGVPSRDFEKTNMTLLTLKVEHELSDSSRLVSSTRYVTSDRQSTLSRPSFLYTRDAETRKKTYFEPVRLDYLQNTDEENELLVTQLDFVTQLSLAGMQHDIVVGGEIYQESYSYYRFTDNTVLSSATVDLFNPNLNVTYTGAITRLDKPAKVEGTGIAIYGLDTIQLSDHWLMTAGLRFEDFGAKGSSYQRTGERDAHGSSIYASEDGLDVSDNFVSYNMSLAYKPNYYTNYYLGYANSQSPSLSTLKASRYDSSNKLDPEEATTLELGAKWQLMGDRLLVNAALFVTEKTVKDRNDDRVYFLAGKQRVEGFELSINGEINDDLSIIASYTHQKSEVLQDFSQDSVGNGLTSTPEHTANVWINYAASDKLSLGAGANYTSGDIYWRKNTAFFDTGSTVLINAMASYQVNDALGLQLNINNLTDKDYITDYSAKGHFLPGAPRNIKLGLTYQF